MKNLSSFFNDNDKVPSKGKISISGKLEAYVGNYYVCGEGRPGAEIYSIYYDESIDSQYEAVDTVEKNLVAYLTSDYKYAFVLESMLEKFAEDTGEYNITYIPVERFDTPELYLEDVNDLPDFMSGIRWIDDDFLSDENIDFDYDAFEIIDSRVEYINPKHFSVKELIHAIEYGKELTNCHR